MFSKNEENQQTLVLAKDIEVDVKKKGNINTTVIGNEQSRKYESFILPNLNKLLGSYVVADLDNKIYEKTNNLFRENDYNVINIDLKENSNYNPFMHIKSDLDALTFSNIITKRNTTIVGDAYKEDMCEIIFRVIVQYSLAVLPIENQNLLFVMNIIDKLKENDVNYFQLVMSKIDTSADVMRYYETIRKLNIETYYLLLDLLKDKLNTIGEQNLKNISNTSSINFNSIGTTKTVLYINISDNSTINSIFFTHLVDSLHNLADENNGFLNVPIYCIFDNFEKIGYISTFQNRIATSRSRKIIYSIITDNLQPLLEEYKNNLKVIIGNCDLCLYLGTNDLETIKYFSENVDGNVSVNTLQELHPKMCMTYERGLAPIKAIKYGVESPSENELNSFSQQIADDKEHEKQLVAEERKKNNIELTKELEDRLNSETNPEKQEGLKKALDVMNLINNINDDHNKK